MENRLMSLFFVFLTAFVGGGLPVFVKIGVKNISPFSFTFLRFLIVSAVLFPLVLKDLKKNVFSLGLLKISLLSTLNILLFSFAIKFTQATISQFIYSFVPALTTLISLIFLKTKIKKINFLGIFLGFLGVVFLILSPLLTNLNFFHSSLIANLMILLGALSYSFYTVFSKKIQNNFSPIAITFNFSLLTTIFSFPLFLFEIFNNYQLISKLNFLTIISLIYVGVLGGIGYYFLYQLAIKKGNPIIASLTLYFQPIFTYFWAMIFLNEKLTTEIIIGALLIFLGSYLVTK